MPSGKTIWLATENKHKLQEARTILGRWGIMVRILPYPKLEIQSSDLEEISSFAADMISKRHGGIVAVEDSGLFVDALEGFPGPYSAYVYQTIGKGGILKLMRNTERRDAYFQSSIAMSQSGHTRKVFTGRALGTISLAEKGNNGFGFDPVFIPQGATVTFGEMSLNQKNEYSHRSKALRKLGKWYCPLL